MNKNYERMTRVYRLFAVGDYDFSEKAFNDMYAYETHGEGGFGKIFTPTDNGYFIGKKLLNITVSMWMERMNTPGWYYFLKELYQEFPTWWLDKIFKNVINKKRKFYQEHGIEFDETFKQ